jgi:hypothetical protein
VVKFNFHNDLNFHFDDFAIDSKNLLWYFSTDKKLESIIL